MLTNAYRLSMEPGVPDLNVYISQYDVGKTLVFTLVNTATSASISSGVNVEIRGTKPDGHGFSYNQSSVVSYSYSNSTAKVTVQVQEQMTAVAGKVVCEIILYKGTPATTTTPASSGYQQLGTANFYLNVERAALDKDTIRSDSSIRQLIDVVDRTDELLEAAEDIQEAYRDYTSALSSKVSINQGIANAGKALVVGLDGNVTLDDVRIPNVAAVALLDCFEHVAWADTHGQEYFNALRAALNVAPNDINLTLGNFTKVEIASGAWGRGTETPTHNSGYMTDPSANRISANISVLDFEEGDVITVGDYSVYKFAVGTNRAATAYSGNTWINDGYQYEDYTLTAQDAPDMKVFFVARVDNADMTQADVEYISTHAGLKRTLTKYVARITAAYDGQSRVYSNTGLYELRPYLTVTAYYTDGTSETVDAYTLTGTLHDRNSIITVSYAESVATVTVTVYELIADSTTFAIGTPIWYAMQSDPDPIVNAYYRLNESENRIGANISVITFNVGDRISFDDYTTYKYAIGTNLALTSPNNRLWINGGYQTADYTLLSEDIADMKCMIITRIDNANMTDNDVAYLSAHMAVLRG